MAISVVKDKPLTVQVGKTATITDEFHLDVDDTTYPDSSITYTITQAPIKGTLLKNGSPTSSFTQDDLNNDRITYQETTPSGSQTTDNFFFRASNPGGDQTATTLFQINITLQPDNPVTATAPPVLSAYENLAAAVTGLQIADDNLQNETYVAVVSASNGTLTTISGSNISGSGGHTVTINGSLGQINTALKALVYNNADSGHDTITITATDQADLTSVSKSIAVTVRPNTLYASLDIAQTPSETKANGINNLGQIVGTYSGGGFLYDHGSYITINDPAIITRPPSSSASVFRTIPADINDFGVITGTEWYSFQGSGLTNHRGFIYSNGTFAYASSQPAPQVNFEGINNSGQIVGFYNNVPPSLRDRISTTGFLYENDSYQTIGPMQTRPYGVNDHGDIVGSFGEFQSPGFFVVSGFIYSDGVFSLFDSPNSQYRVTIATDINNAGLIVGYVQAGFSPSTAPSRGFAYDSHSGVWTTIDVPGAQKTEVYGINDANQIVGLYTDANGAEHGFVATVPPPLPTAAGNVDEWLLFNAAWDVTAGPGSHPAGFRVAAVADFTGNGISDILWQNVTTGAVDLWKMSQGAWAGSVDFGTHPGAGFQIAGAGDFNGDGTKDVFWFDPATGQADIWQLANGQWAASVYPGNHPTGYQVAGIGDFNRDGTDDILWFNPATRHVDEWNIVNGQWAGSNNIGFHPGAGFQIAGVGDFNEDGSGDVFWYNPSTGATDIWLLRNGTWSASATLGNHATGWNVAGIGDFNADGNSDVLWYNPTTRATEIWIIMDSHLVTFNNLGVHPGPATIAGIGDFNGGGTSDILWHQFV